MDADFKKKRRDRSISRREERWSMDSQRFEAILTEIRNGYNNIKKNFDQVKVAEILEEIITEYAVAALQAQSAPKFTELAVLLQHCSELYGKKVDFLYQHVLEVCESVAAASAAARGDEEADEGGGGGERSPGKRQRRRASVAALGHGEFRPIEVTRCAASRRLADTPPRPPPTLPRMYIELEPRVLQPHEQPLRDYEGEPLGLPADYYAGCRLHAGFLVDELSAPGAAPAAPAARPLSLLELQAAIEAAAPAPLSPPPPADTLEPLCASTPLPSRVSPDSALGLDSPADEPSPLALESRKRKRRSSPVRVELSLRLRVTPGLRRYLSRARDFSVSGAWVARLVRRRAADVLRGRRRRALAAAFRGFDLEPRDAGGFPGWSAAEVAEAARTELDASARLLCDSDDDGFFERSSFTGSESSRRSDAAAAPAPPPPPPPGAPPCDGTEARRAALVCAEAAAWSAGVVARALAAEARAGAGDMRRLRERVRGALAPGETLPFPALLAREARAAEDVSQLLLASLVMATSGELHITRGAPLSVDTFSVRALPHAAPDPEPDPRPQPELEPQPEPHL